jgi:cyclophilin family peptidyl-prolyl cis-trans isomerase/HEAT repeat protein
MSDFRTSQLREDMKLKLFVVLVSLCGIGAAIGCARTPTVVVPTLPTFDEKISWILRLEDQRLIRDASDSTVLTHVVEELEALVQKVPMEPDLVALLSDGEPQIRRRAALALGRLGLKEAVEPLISSLGDPQVEVRQMSAFALGLVGDIQATSALVDTLEDFEPIVQGRAAEALGRIGAVDAAPAIGRLVSSYITAAYDLDPDDLSYPLSAEVEAFRLALYALGTLGAYDTLAEAVLQPNGQPILWWWPVAYALQSTGDPRALEALVTLAGVQGSVGVAFAAEGLGKVGHTDSISAVDALLALLDLNRRDDRVIATAIRALSKLDDPRIGHELREFAIDLELSPVLRLTTLVALQHHNAVGATDVFIELMTDPWPPMRAAALKALARTDPDTFMLVLSGLGRDSDWRVRVALAEGLAFTDVEAATRQLELLLQDEDTRVIPYVLQSMVTQQLPDVEMFLLDHLKHEDVVIRKTAANLLGVYRAKGASSLSDAEMVSALDQAFEISRNDPSYLARAAILDTAAAIGGLTAQRMLTEALSDPDWATRIRAAKGLDSLMPDVTHSESIRPAPGRRSVNFEAPALVRPTVSPHVYVETDYGTIELELNVIDAPLTSDNFMTLARLGFYDGLTFHRVVPNYVVQGGDPRADSEGGPGYTLRDELNQLPYLRGTVGVARDWQDTGGSQFFITHSPQPDLDGRYTAFARVVDGMDVVDQIRPGDLIRRVLVWDGVSPL